jgi:hypothetical protein
MAVALFANSPGARDDARITLDASAAARPADQRPRGACDASASDLCYDLTDRRIVYRAARRYMPEVGGLTAESISLRRDGVRLKYSFR